MSGTIVRTVILMFGLCFALTVRCEAQERIAGADPEPAKGQIVVLKIPGKLLGFEKVNYLSGSLVFGTVIEQSADGKLLVSNRKDWQDAGWPLMRQLTVDKVSREKSFALVELSDSLIKVKLRFENAIGQLGGAFREIAHLGLVSEFEASDYYRTKVIGEILPRIFAKHLSKLSAGRKLALIRELNYVDSAISTTSFKDQGYLAIDVGSDTQIYNDIRTDQSQRIAHALNQRVLTYFKRIAKIIRYDDSVDGIKITILIPYKNFLTERYSVPHYDVVEIFAGMDVISQFADDELTGQEFVNETILLVNGNRTRIPILESF